MSISPQNYTISDLVEWYAKKQLVLSPEFQRGSVWTESAKVFLIDTILNDFPMPQIYFRTKINPTTQSVVREVVDGQQRLRAIFEFASGNLRLTSKSAGFKGMTYSDLAITDQERFLSYKVSAVQLINATDSTVLEVFARLNSYSVKVTPAELRQAEYTEPVKWAIYDSTRKWHVLWDSYRVVSVRDSVRLKNSSLIAELFMAIDKGVADGGEPAITRYYKSKKDKDENYFFRLSSTVDNVIEIIISNIGQDFRDTTFFSAPNFLMLFCAVSFLQGKLPPTKVTDAVNQYRGVGVDWTKGKRNLAELSQALDDPDDNNSRYANFVAATRSSTHRISSRQPRLETLIEALRKDEAY